MVATRRGARVNSPTKTKPEQPSEVQDTPSTGRRTRRAAKLEETLAETCSKLEKSEDEALPSNPTSTKKRCTRASRLHSPEQPCTPVGSTHEADVSDLESCCSAVSDPDPPAKSTRRKRQSHAENQADEEVSEVESCSSAVSGSKAGYSTRRSTRKKTVPESSDIAQAEAGTVKVELTLETESCSSVVSESQRVTRSQRKTARTRSTAKKHIEDSELSDADSCTSAASRRRSRRQIQPIPLHLDELSESSQSPIRITLRTRAAGGKVETTLDVSEPPSCESEGLECGPTKSLTTLRRGRSRSAGPKDVDSDSEVTNVHSSVGSPGSTRGRGTPCSSRTGSGTSSRGAPASRRSVKDCSVVVENPDTSEDNSLNDSRLENTVIAEDADCTLLEENEIERSEVQEGKNTSDRSSSDTNTENLEKEIIDISEDNSHIGPSESVFPEDTSEPAVIAVDQQEEPSTETSDRDASEMEMMQETVPPSEPSGPCSSVTVTICEKASEMTEEAEEEQEAADTHLSETDKPLDEDAVVGTQLDGEEKMEVNMLKTEVQQVADTSAAQAEPIQVTSVQQHRVTIDSESEQQPKDVIIQKTKIISLLDSSDDDEFDEEERDVSEEGDLEPRDEERAGPSNKSEATAASVDGLFMIDTRPGQEADEDYYREGREEEAEQEEDEFVDEEVEDDDDDEDAKVLFSSRDSHSKELSSRIDPGIRLKELGGLYISFDGSKSKPDSSSLQKLKEKKIQDEVMKKSVIGPDFEKKDAVPPYSDSKQAIKLKRRAEREKSTGDGWFNMKAPEMSQELKGDLQALKMRGSVDPKRFYKKNDRDGFPKYFQFGKVVDSPVDFYHSRIPKKERKRTMVEELLADADFRHQNKKRFQQIMMEKAAQGAGKRNNKKKKFHKT
ncbi:deoxynucleotidyltransferase terminal-interacting protein 2 [Melanotaenia boesemani]|uniref:deoxynucleotidyltransferase terminal-interacting protein 2 n=1 Tax=Melanotaenia boesemani TaxID=1250792 RepID=UPI001C05C2C2|nr:deoxynucleotidyltransferase terminal-interacting protein 2 [Melanotaenia boesemani]